MRRLAVVAVFVVAGGGVAVAQEDPTGSWSAETSAYYFARGGSATDGTYHYLFGGYQVGVTASFPSYYRQARRYDPAAGTWTTLAGLPIIASDITYQYNAGAYVDGRLYSFGTSYQGGTGVVLSYSIADNAWSVLEGVSLPGGRYGSAAAVLGGLVYVAGGYAGGPSRRVDEFNPSSNSFRRVADLPAALYLHAMAAIPARGAAYVVGGSDGSGYRASCYEYSPASDTWTTRSPMEIDGVARPRGYPAAFVLRSRIYVSGGHSGSAATSTVFEYYPASDRWSQRASMAGARYQHAAVAIGGRGFVYGGLSVYSTGEEYTPPDFGPAPDPPTDAAQSGLQPESSVQAKADPADRDGWMSRRVSFTATVTDPDPAQEVRLRVRVRRAGSEAWAEFDSGLRSQGAIRIDVELPLAGAYDWEYRVEDADGNSVPEDPESWRPAFGNTGSPDFRCDAAPPADPIGLYPSNLDIGVAARDGGDVHFGWEKATDDGPASGLVHEIEIGAEPHVLKAEVGLSFPADVGSASIRLPVARHVRWWRVRARDIAGQVSAWSAPLSFRVTWNDGVDHAAGDAERSCGFGTGSRPSWAGAALAAALAAAGSIVHRRRRRRRGAP